MCTTQGILHVNYLTNIISQVYAHVLVLSYLARSGPALNMTSRAWAMEAAVQLGLDKTFDICMPCYGSINMYFSQKLI